MWKWTDGNDIRVIIIDVDSICDDQIVKCIKTNFNNVQLATVSIDKQKKETVNFIYSDINELLYRVMNKTNCFSSSIVAISDNILFIKDMMLNHIGTIFTQGMKENLLLYIPDYLYISEQKLINILSGQNVGYIAEALASNNAEKRKNILRCNIEITLNNGMKKDLNVFLVEGIMQNIIII